jgi:hypothetical protein
MHSERAIEIVVSDVQRLIFSPLVNTHFLYQTKIENLGIVWSGNCLVRKGMQMITGKVHALITVCDAFLACAAKNITWFIVAQE